MFTRLWLVLLFFPAIALAEVTVNPRYDYIQSQNEELANRLVLSATLAEEKGPFKLFIEGFGDFETNEDQRILRRSPMRGYLQEAYLEFNFDAFYLRAGKQALRWSESWVLPSLDVWSGRKFNRLYFDPFKDQLNHSSGVSLSYAGSLFSLDLAFIGEYAETQLPYPLPETLQEPRDELSYGLRLKSQAWSMDYSIIAAKVPDSEALGVGLNYAFDDWVPKLEFGMQQKDSKSLGNFLTLGADLFLGDWILVLQGTQLQDKSRIFEQDQTLLYGSLQWRPDKHELTLQAYANTTLKDQFLALSYGYQVHTLVNLSAFAQNYGGEQGLYAVYQEMTQETVIGLRAELNHIFDF